jgi:phage shock protein A
MTLLRTIRRLLRHLEARVIARLDSLADPRVQVDQAIEEGYRRHELLRQQAAMVIAAEHSLRQRLERAHQDTQRLERAVADALAAGKEEIAVRLAGRLAVTDTTTRSLGTLLPPAVDAAARAREAVDRSRLELLQTGEERLRLLGRLETAKLLERSTALSIGPASGQDGDVPSLDHVGERIDQRWAVASGNAELAASETDAQLGQLEQLLLEAAGRRRLDEIRDRLRLEGPPSQAGR